MSFISSYHPSPNERIRYFGSGTQDGHGGRGAEHRAEMEQIATRMAQKKIEETIPSIKREAYQEAISALYTALEFDVETVVQIAFDNGDKIWRDSKTQKAIAAALMKEIKKRLPEYIP